MTIKMNEALIKEINRAKIKNHSIIEKATGIDKSTISLHLNSRRPISIEQAKAYAKFLDVPLIKVIDDTIVKYRVVKYVDEEGVVSNPSEEDFDVILAPNDIQSLNHYAIYDKEQNTVFWYDPEVTCNNSSTEKKYCFIKSKEGEFLGYVEKYVKNDLTFRNAHTNKKHTVYCTLCYPVVGVTFCDFAQHKKINNSL
tara:strand:- start:7174 stop:7764 length:591 start_codon:yes stop_codon:yes gene_type:complete